MEYSRDYSWAGFGKEFIWGAATAATQIVD